jgi:elongation factor G
VDPDTGRREARAPSPRESFSALVFKVVAQPSADLFWIRVYSGTLRSDERCYHPRSDTRMRLRRPLRIHADRTEPVECAECGDIVAVPGLKNVVTGDTLCDPERRVTYERIRFPETVVSVAVEPQTSADRDRLLDVASRLAREDPTFTCHTDEDTGQLILSGMGELHLEVLANRMRRDFNVHARFGRPRVAYRETVGEPARGTGEFDRRIADLRVFASAVIEIVPRPRPAGAWPGAPVEVRFGPTAAALAVPLRQAVARVLADVCSAGGPSGYPVVDVEISVAELHLSDAPDNSVPLLASLTMALRRAFAGTRMVLLEPVMRLEVRVPEEFVGNVVRDLSSRRAEISETGIAGAAALVRALTPLSEMLGYSNELRSLTQGRGSFSMEPYDYHPVPDDVLARQAGRG